MGFSLSRPSLPLSLKPRQRLTPTSSMEVMVLATTATVSATTDWATGLTTARGRLRLSPRPLLSPTMATTDLATTELATATDLAMSTARGRLRLRLIPTSTAATTAMDLATATATVLATAGDTIGDKLL